MEQKNFLLAMVLIVSFLLLWSFFVVPRFTPPPAPPVPAEGRDLSHASANVPAEIKSAHEQRGEPVVLTNTILRDENNEIVLSPKGGAVKNWRLKSKGQEVDLVLNPDDPSLPLASFPDAVYKVKVGNEKAVMDTTLPNGVHVTKTLALSSAGHLHRLSYRFHNPTAKPIEVSRWELGWGPGLGTTPTEQKENKGLIHALSVGVKRHVVKENEEAPIKKWAGIENRYFLVAFIPKIPHDVNLAVTGAKENTYAHLYETTRIPAHGNVTLDYDLYVGPKGYSQLKQYGLGLEESVDFGTFSIVGKFILSMLNWLKAKTGNYGAAIILLTVGIQILMSPLTIKSFKATLSMKKLQPKIAEIQARFKNDPKRLNIEMMNVYKSSGTNPFGGCLPMLLQLPIFWALFTALRNAYELRGAPFIGWMHDLSAPDVLLTVAGFPLHALPLIMGVAMFFQQRMSGAVSDPTQKQMMMMMPIMFTFMFYGFPSGLVLYWLTNNLMTMGFQWGFQRYTTGTPSVVDTTLIK